MFYEVAGFTRKIGLVDSFYVQMELSNELMLYALCDEMVNCLDYISASFVCSDRWDRLQHPTQCTLDTNWW